MKCKPNQSLDAGISTALHLPGSTVVAFEADKLRIDKEQRIAPTEMIRPSYPNPFVKFRF
jgi:hypothetical protein